MRAIAVVAFAAAMLAGVALGQSQSGQVIGEVTALVAQSRQISLNTIRVSWSLLPPATALPFAGCRQGRRISPPPRASRSQTSAWATA